jgi:drug/metabolite transporter (DMT)-like permease
MTSAKNVYTGICLALLPVIIWSVNFIIARGVFKQIPPVSLAFYRWSVATLFILPFAVRSFRAEWPVVKQSLNYFFWTSLTGIALFNTFVYIGAHDTTAINLSLIGTTSSPVFAVILAWIFLKEQIGAWKIVGLFLCLSGVLFLLSNGHLRNLLMLHFTAGDGWVLLAGLSFAVYTTLARKKPAGISAITFLLVTFSIGTLLLLPFYLWENFHAVPVVWNGKLLLTILFLSLGASVVSFLSWNSAVGKLGAGRTALFGNFIPVFTSLEATLFLDEKFTSIHLISMLLVFTGIILANRESFKILNVKSKI